MLAGKNQRGSCFLLVVFYSQCFLDKVRINAKMNCDLALYFIEC